MEFTKTKILEISSEKENNRQIEIGPQKKNPVTINFTIEKEDYNKLEYGTQNFKWTIYDALAFFCANANKLVESFEIELDMADENLIIPKSCMHSEMDEDTANKYWSSI